MIRHAAVDPDAARKAARSILSGHEFQAERSPQPLKGALEWIGDRLHEIFDPVGRFFEWLFGPLFRLFPGTTGLVVGTVLLLAIAVGAIWLMTRQRIRSVARARTETGGAGGQPEDAAALERAAREAEAAGDFARAVRLRYRAGLLRLDQRGAIHVQPGITNAVYARSLRSVRFDGLTDTFESVTYGTEPAGRGDAETAEREWPLVVTETATS